MTLRAIALIAASLTVAPGALAEEGGGDVAGAAEPDEPAGGTAEGADRSCFVLVLPSAAGDDVELAVRAHLADVGAHLVVVRSDLFVPFREHLATAGDLATLNEATGVVWVDLVSFDGDVLLYLFDRDGTRTMVRRLEGGETTAAARVEELGLVTRSIVTAVMEGGTVDVRPPVEETPREVVVETEGGPPPVEPEPAPPRHFEDVEPRAPFIEIAVGYAGQLLHESMPWQSGVRAAAAWLSPSNRWSAGVAYLFWVPTPFDVETVTLRVQRHSWEVFGSFGVSLRSVRVGGELALFGELSRRETLEIQGGAAGPESHLVLGLGLRIRLDLQIWRWLGVAAVVGVDGLVRRVRYLVETPESEVLVDPLLIRPVVGLSLCGRFGR